MGKFFSFTIPLPSFTWLKQRPFPLHVFWGIVSSPIPYNMRTIAFFLLLSLVAYRSQHPETARNIVFLSADAGRTWQDLSAGLPENLRVEYVYARAGEVFLGSENGGLYKSAKAPAACWEKIETGGLFPHEKITGIFPGASGMYVSIFQGGFFQNPQGSDRWRSCHKSLKDLTVRAVLETPEALFVGNDSGIFKSEDGGASWKQVFSGGQVTSLVLSEGILMGGGFRGVLRSVDGGESWDWALTDGGTYKMRVIDGKFVQVSLAGELHVSGDGGISWQRMDEGLPRGKAVYDIAKSGGYLFCSHSDGIFRKADWGNHWELVHPNAGGIVLGLGVSGGLIYAGAVSGC